MRLTPKPILMSKRDIVSFANPSSPFLKLGVIKFDYIPPNPWLVWFRRTILNGPPRKILCLKVLATKEFGFWLILQYCLANIAWFIRLNFLSPNPPQDLSQQILFQLSKCNFLTPWAWPHQKALTIESIFLQIVSGTLKQKNVYKWRVWRIEAIKSGPPNLRKEVCFPPL